MPTVMADWMTPRRLSPTTVRKPTTTITAAEAIDTRARVSAAAITAVTRRRPSIAAAIHRATAARMSALSTSTMSLTGRMILSSRCQRSQANQSCTDQTRALSTNQSVACRRWLRIQLLGTRWAASQVLAMKAPTAMTAPEASR